MKYRDEAVCDENLNGLVLFQRGMVRSGRRFCPRKHRDGSVITMSH
ncbi:hypothetical protein SS05631_c12780 [Sinorhizobium sp. CCBAU 05631]|nr:hypothetical protein SS05631_c12780 [Sinorhizobium sp. CCBAU 05631]